MSITTRDQLIAALAASRRNRFFKVGPSTAAGVYQAMWRQGGWPAAAAAGPSNGTGVAYTRSTQGALLSPAAASTSYLGGMDATANQSGTILLCDRVAEWGVDAAVNTSQSMGAVTLPARATSATDLELWLEVETALGATGTGNITINHTDQASAAKSATAPQFAVSSPAGRAQPVPVAAGVTGVKSLTSVQLTTASTGKLSVVLRRTLCAISIAFQGDGKNQGYTETDLEIVGDDACLELLWLPAGSTAANLMGSVSIAQG